MCLLENPHAFTRVGFQLRVFLLIFHLVLLHIACLWHDFLLYLVALCLILLFIWPVLLLIHFNWRQPRCGGSCVQPLYREPSIQVQPDHLNFYPLVSLNKATRDEPSTLSRKATHLAFWNWGKMALVKNSNPDYGSTKLNLCV